MIRRRHRRPLSVLPLPLIVAQAIALVAGCGASAHSISRLESHEARTVIAPSTETPATLSLRADRVEYAIGDSITLSLVNRSALAFEGDESCATPTAFWLRSQSGATYFANSGAMTTCPRTAAVEPGAASAVATFDSTMVWIDRSSDERLYRLPQALPPGRYTVHALTARGELVTSLELR